MKKNELNGFDITSFDIELEFNQKIAPIYKTIESLHNELQNKSVQTHKDFLAREKLVAKTMADIRLAHQEQIERIKTENQDELDVLLAKEQQFSSKLEDYITLVTKENNLLLAQINADIETLKQSEAKDLEAISTHYKENITKHVEVNNIFKSNFDHNMQTQNQTIEQYKVLLAEKINEISQLKQETDQLIEETLSQFIASKESENKNISQTHEEIERDLNKDTTNIRKDSNLKTKEIKTMVDEMKKSIHDRYVQFQSILSTQADQIKKDLQKRNQLIDKDLEIHLEKLNQELSSELDSLSGKTQKSINMKFELFNLRAKTTKQYEKAMADEALDLIQKEITYIQKVLDDELQNLDKLEIFFLNDQNEIKDSGDYFKSLNLSMKKELNQLELANNTYLVNHEKLKATFLKNYNALFHDFKTHLIELNQGKLDQMTEINHEIDEIHHYLDLFESQKEIQVNDLREAIEINEIKEQYQIKFAKQNHRLTLLQHELSTSIAIEEARINDLRSENQLQIEIIQFKMNLEQELEEIKSRSNELEELHLQRLDNFKFERAILDHKYSKELSVIEHKQQAYDLQTKRNIAMMIKELEAKINIMETQITSQSEVVQQHLEEEIIKLNEKINEYIFEKDSIAKKIQTDIDIHAIELDKQKHLIHLKFDKNHKMIEDALDHETKESRKNLAKVENMINDRIYKLEYSSLMFDNFYQTSKSTLMDTHLSLEELSTTVGTHTALISQAKTYISKTYEVLDQAVDFMFDLEKRVLDGKITACTDLSETKKLNKTMQTLLKDQEKKLQYILTTKKENEDTILSDVVSAFDTINKQNLSDKSEYIVQIGEVYQQTYDNLQSFKNSVITDVEALYSPISKSDRDHITYVKENAKKAIELNDLHRQEECKTLEDTFESYRTEQERIKSDSNRTIDEKIKPLQEKIDELTTIAKQKLEAISSEYEELLSLKRVQLEEINQKQMNLFAWQQEKLATAKNNFDQEYQSALDHFAQKKIDEEKIFSYQSNINLIAIESAKARYSDELVKANALHKQTLESNASAIKLIHASKLKWTNDADKELADAIASFEQSILETKPRLEKEIIDVQKGIDKDIYEKEMKLKSLLKVQAKTMKYLTEDLLSKFQNGYEAIHQNLQDYLSQYKQLSSQYSASIDQSIQVIDQDNKTLANA
ncbi:MAG: hypothetical protein KJ847_01830, partial [Firmicutes bacterium]|nr:hypothetical protein [Bacillota bacterium]